MHINFVVVLKKYVFRVNVEEKNDDESDASSMSNGLIEDMRFSDEN